MTSELLNIIPIKYVDRHDKKNAGVAVDFTPDAKDARGQTIARLDFHLVDEQGKPMANATYLAKQQMFAIRNKAENTLRELAETHGWKNISTEINGAETLAYRTTQPASSQAFISAIPELLTSIGTPNILANGKAAAQR